MAVELQKIKAEGINRNASELNRIIRENGLTLDSWMTYLDFVNSHPIFTPETISKVKTTVSGSVVPRGPTAGSEDAFSKWGLEAPQ